MATKISQKQKHDKKNLQQHERWLLDDDPVKNSMYNNNIFHLLTTTTTTTTTATEKSIKLTNEKKEIVFYNWS